MFALLLIFIALGALVEILSLRRDPDKIDLSCSLSASFTEPDTPFEVTSVITNRSRLPISYMLLTENFPMHTQIPEGLEATERNQLIYVKNVCRIGGRQRKKRSVEITIAKRGVHLFLGGTMDFGDFLGIKEISKEVSFCKEIVVYPKKLEDSHLTDALGNFCGDIAARRFLIRDPILTVGYREYTGREPMRDIHWMQSARKNELMVREFDYNRQLSATVVLSVEGIASFDAELLDACCSTARTVCETLTNLGVLVNFHTNARIFARDRTGIWSCEASPGKLGVLLEGLGRASSYLACPVGKLLGHIARANTSDNAYVIILPEATPAAEAAAAELRRNTGQEVMLVPVTTKEEMPA